MRRAALALALGLPLLFAALPLGSLLFADRDASGGEAVVTVTDVPAPLIQEDPELAMRPDPERVCSHASTTHIEG